MRLSQLVLRNLARRSLPRSSSTSRRVHLLQPPPLTVAQGLNLRMADSAKVAGAAGLVTRAERQGHLGSEPGGLQLPAGEAPVGDKLAVSGWQPLRPGHLTPQFPGLRAPGMDIAGQSMGSVGQDGCDSGRGGAPSPFLTVHIAVSDEQGQRNYMEDRHTVISDFRPQGADPSLARQFVAVYDGHASFHGSEHASRRVHQIVAEQPAIQQCTGSPCDQDAVVAALKEAFEDADEEIVAAVVEGGRRYGTTAVCALRIGSTIYVAHAGDSRAVLCRNGRAITLTRDHKPASVPEERQRIEAQGGLIAYEADRVHSNPEGQRRSRLAMSRALGDPDFKQPRRLVEAEPDVARVELCPHSDTFLLLGSDGLFDVMSGQEAVEEASHALSSAQGGPSRAAAAEAAANALVQQALKQNTSDNVTALLMLFDWD